MARHIPNQAAKTEEANPHAPKPAMAGGALGVPEEKSDGTENKAATAIGGQHIAQSRQLAPRESAPPREFRVVDGPRRRNGDGQLQSHITVMYDGCLTAVHPGKVYAEHQIDLDSLRRQGVKFEELNPQPPPAVEA